MAKVDKPGKPDERRQRWVTDYILPRLETNVQDMIGSLSHIDQDVTRDELANLDAGQRERLEKLMDSLTRAVRRLKNKLPQRNPKLTTEPRGRLTKEKLTGRVRRKR
jgi:hypothetical protein